MSIDTGQQAPPAPEQVTPRWTLAVKRNGNTLGLLALALVIAVVFSAINPGSYATLLNVESIAFSIPEVGLMALAISVAMTIAGIDLSTVAVANLTAIFIAWYSRVGVEQGQGQLTTTLIAVAGGLLIGVLCGLLNGLVIAKLKVAPILTTLATMQIFTGVAVAITRGEAAYGVTDPLSSFGYNSLLGVPIVFWLFGAVVVAVWLLMTKTKYGVSSTMMGASRTAAEYSGIAYTWVVTRTYVLAGLISAVAGLVLVSRTASASAGYGSSYLMLAITIAVLGGANPFGGRVAVVGAALAAIVLQLIASGLNMMGVSTYIYQIVQGLILVGVFVVAFERKRVSEAMSRRRRQPNVQATQMNQQKEHQK
ncbi:ABC transporter permease [Demequina sediminicola]|uniref:ABC transporter permease n=1 Tax=Demequina sediminicola TaxID=1095026 RepID=UPI0007839DD7|nr:ABC transporter permease [Demequina sediminicola]